MPGLPTAGGLGSNPGNLIDERSCTGPRLRPTRKVPKSLHQHPVGSLDRRWDTVGPQDGTVGS